MRAITTIDHQPESGRVAVWVTSPSGLEAKHTNAVLIDAANDPAADEKVRSLTRCCIVLTTQGSSLAGLPVEGASMTLADLADLRSQIQAAQERILRSIDNYRARVRGGSLVAPTFLDVGLLSLVTPDIANPSGRAFATATYLARLWTAWLQSDEERRRRTVQPKTGKSPWFMPAEMNDPMIPDFPHGYADGFTEQALV